MHANNRFLSLVTAAAVMITLVAVIDPAAAGQRSRSARKPAPDPDRALAVQVMLDRAGFSPGQIDGKSGNNTRRAVTAFQAARSLPETGEVDEATWLALGGATESPLVPYVITPEDVAGPFVESIPRELPDQAELPGLYYTSIVEALGERFHVNPQLLRTLNPQAKLEAGETIQVPNVEPLTTPAAAAAAVGTTGAGAGRAAGTAGANRGAATAAKAEAKIVVSKAKSALKVLDAAGATVFYAPVTIGSERDPLPIGEWNVTAVVIDPPFHYNPDLFWDGDPSHSKAKIPAGPNNPVGRVWIDLTKEHYGIHGTPEPSRIGYTESHGCVRLTNWDALRLARLVQKGTQVVFEP